MRRPPQEPAHAAENPLPGIFGRRGTAGQSTSKSGAGRPRGVKLPDSARVTVRLEPELREMLDEYAKAEGLTRAEAVRQVLTSSGEQLRTAIAGRAKRDEQRRFLMLTEEALLELSELTEELEGARLGWDRVGTNANQLAARANAGGSPTAREVEALREEVTNARKEIRRLAAHVSALIYRPDAVYRAAEVG